MMKLLRNPEVCKTLLLFAAVSALFSAAVFIMDYRFGMCMLLACAVFTSIYAISTYVRYRRISCLAADINRILHGDSHISFEKYSEGELSVLQSEIYKMTVRLNEQQQRLLDDKRYLSDSIADISHQIRTPLTSINLLVSFLSEENITDERRKKLSYELFGLLSRIDWLITALLKISKLDAGTVEFKTESISVRELIREATAPIAVPMELRGQSLEVSAEGMFYGDVSWTVEALTNIIKNCAEHIPDSGRIEISAAENALYTEIIVKDNGSGIDKDDLPHIFERFYKGKNSGEKSFGIGLALSRMIISSQSGTVKAENNANGGAKFTVRFYKGTV